MKNNKSSSVFAGVNGHNGNNAEATGFSEGDLLLQVGHQPALNNQCRRFGFMSYQRAALQLLLPAASTSQSRLSSNQNTNRLRVWFYALVKEYASANPIMPAIQVINPLIQENRV